MATTPSQNQVIRFGVFEVDLAAGEVRKAGMKQKLAGQPFQVLQALLEHPQEIVTREELRGRLWPSSTFVDYELALKKAVNRLREVLGDSAESPHYIETVPRKGYRFIASVERVNGASTRAEVSLQPELSSDRQIVAALVRRHKAAVVVAALVVALTVVGFAAWFHFRTSIRTASALKIFPSPAFPARNTVPRSLPTATPSLSPGEAKRTTIWTSTSS